MKPILFNTEMVRAILDGRKTQTRRICNFNILDDERHFGCNKKSYIQLSDGDYGCPNCGGMHFKQYQPKYKVGDILYVRETWNYDDQQSKPYYKADFDTDSANALKMIWKPSIHMPKKYTRIFLKVTNVRVERLLDISSSGYISEGFDFTGYNTFTNIKDCEEWWINLWNSTAKDGYKWEDNPYVFVYEFERVENDKKSN